MSTDRDGDTAEPISAMVRGALFVRDLERSVRFYRDCLGLRETYHRVELAHEAVASLLGLPPGGSARAHILKAPGPAFGMVGLFQLTPAPPEVPKLRGRALIGEACLVFYAPDLDRVMACLTEFGGEVLCPPTYLQVVPPGGQREMTLYDPDGIMVNLIERGEQRWHAPPPRGPQPT